MNKQFLGFLALGLAAVGAVIVFTLVGTKGAHLELQGRVLKVRTMPADEKSTIAVVDFRITNPSNVPFVVREAVIQIDQSNGQSLDGAPIAKVDMNRYFEYYKLIGPKYNEILTIPDTVAPHQTMDRMVAARLEIPETEFNARKALRISITEIDGALAEIK